MYKLIVVIILVLINVVSYSQIFDTIISSSKHSSVTDLVELPNGDVLLTAYEGLPNDTYGGVLMIFDENGELKIDSSFYENNYSIFFDNSFIINNQIIVIGSKTHNSNLNKNTDSILIKKLDFSLNEIESYSYHFSDTLVSGFLNCSYDHIGNLIISAFSIDMNNGRHPFIWKIDANFNLIAKNDTMTHSWLSSFFKMIDIKKDSAYYVFAYAMSNDYADMIMKFDYDLNYISMDSTRQKLTYPYSPIVYRKNEIMHVGKRSFHFIQESSYSIIILDSNFNKKWYKLYTSIDTAQVPALFNSISKNGNNVYIGAIVNSDYWISNDTTWLQLTKMDTNYNIIWEKRFLGNRFDLITNILATSDGGCIITSWTHDSNDMYNTNIHIVKIDSSGTATWVNIIKQKSLSVNIFPNPAKDDIIINIKSDNRWIEFIRVSDMLGREVMSKRINDKQAKLDVSSLSKGVYIVEGYSSNGSSFSGKFIKE